MNKDNIFKVIFSSTFIILAILMICFDWFKSRIDGTVIALFVIAFLPWLAKYVKSLEAFGIKTELVDSREKEKINREMDNITKEVIDEDKMIDKKIKINKNEPLGSEKNPIIIESIESISRTNDPVEKMMLIRYELEKKIKALCRINNIQTYNQSIRYIVEKLRKEKIIKNNVANLILDLLPMLNRAVHSEIYNVNYKDLEWIINKGSDLITYLEIISKDPNSYWMFLFNN